MDISNPQWGLDDAFEIIRPLQKTIRSTNYHVALGGEVLNKGFSDKDLDLYFIPFSEQGPEPEKLREVLQSWWGTEYNLGGPTVRAADVHLAYPDEPTWINGRFTYWLGVRRIDCFIA